MKRVLVTGFEPFGGASLNPSQLVAAELAARSIAGLEIATAVLPVAYEPAATALLLQVEALQPAAVVCLGQAEGRGEVSFERIAINLDDASIADNAGELRVGRAIAPEGPTAYWTTLPIDRMVAAVRATGVPVGYSLSAGSFVCNHIFYRLQAALAGTAVSSGFVHLPLVPEQSAEFPGRPVLPLLDQVRAVAAALSALAE